MKKFITATVVALVGAGVVSVTLYVTHLRARMDAMELLEGELGECARQVRDLRTRLAARQGRQHREPGERFALLLDDLRRGARQDRPGPEGEAATDDQRDDRDRGPAEWAALDQVDEPDEADRGAHEARERLEAEQLRTAARSDLIGAGELDDAQVAQLDAAVGRMNDQLQTIAEDFRSRVGGREPTPRESMALAADALGVLLEGGDEIRGLLREEQAASAPDDSLDPLSYVDPDLHDVMREMDDYQGDHGGHEGPAAGGGDDAPEPDE